MAHLYIECDAARPWASPWIWLSSDANGEARIDKATLAQPCYINVKVGTKETSFPAVSPRVKVQMWVCDYTLGIGPASVRQYTGGSFPEAGQTASIIERPTDPPGSKTITTSAPQVARLAWTPLSGDMRNVNAQGEAHMCVAANTYWGGSNPPAEGAPMPPPDVINVCAEQHHGQLNIGILPKGDEEIEIDVHHAKWWQEDGRDGDRRYTIEIREPVGRLGTVERETLAIQRFVKLTGVDMRAVRRKLPRDSEGRALEPLVRTALRAGAKPTIRGKPLGATRRKLRFLELEAGGKKGRKLEVRVPTGRKPLPVLLHAALADADPIGAFKVLDVVQRRGNRVLGGARVLVVKDRR